MSATPPLPRVDESQRPGRRRWMHELRNELNTAMMAAAAARRLVQDGDDAEALENLRRTEWACQRCAQLLQRAPDSID